MTFVEGSKGVAMREPDGASSLVVARRAIVGVIVVAGVMAVAVSVRDGAVASGWTNGIGALLGGLAGTFVGEGLERFGGRVAATRIAWLQMAGIGVALAGIVAWQALPAYCQLPVSFVVGVGIGAAAVFLQRVRLG